MADKSWLIRTKNRQILGPATKQKVIELLEKGSLSGEDEITCGNGYWFWVRERDLVEKYLYGDLPQSFNPISEAQDVLTAKSSADGITASMTAAPAAKPATKETKNTQADTNLPQGDDLAYPDEDDLGYPDMGGVAQAAPPVKPAPMKAAAPTPVITEKKAPVKPPEVEVSSQVEGDDNTLFPSLEDLEYPELVGAAKEAYESQAQEVDPDSTAEIESMTLEAAREEFNGESTDSNISIPSVDDLGADEVYEAEEDDQEESEENDEEEHEQEYEEEYEEPKSKKKKKRVAKKAGGNDRYLIYIGILLFVVIGVVIYYFKVIINKPIPYIGIASVQAQTISSLSKKKI